MQVSLVRHCTSKHPTVYCLLAAVLYQWSTTHWLWLRQLAIVFWSTTILKKDLEDCNCIIELVSRCQYTQLVYISTVDVYRTHSYGTNRQYLENALAELPNSYIVRLPSLIGPSVNKNILYDLKTKSWLNKICLDSNIQWYPLKRLESDIKNSINNNIKYQNLCSEPISNRDIVQKFFPELIEQLDSNQLTPVDYNLSPYTIPLEEIWQSFEEFFIDHCVNLVYNKTIKGDLNV